MDAFRARRARAPTRVLRPRFDRCVRVRGSNPGGYTPRTRPIKRFIEATSRRDRPERAGDAGGGCRLLSSVSLRNFISRSVSVEMGASKSNQSLQTSRAPLSPAVNRLLLSFGAVTGTSNGSHRITRSKQIMHPYFVEGHANTSNICEGKTHIMSSPPWICVAYPPRLDRIRRAGRGRRTSTAPAARRSGWSRSCVCGVVYRKGCGDGC